MERQPASLTTYYSVQLRDDGPTISVITQSYYLLLTCSATPSCYSIFKYQNFLSRLSLTQLSVLTPFHVKPTGELEMLPASSMSSLEVYWHQWHRAVQLEYWIKSLAPAPIWKLVGVETSDVSDEQELLTKLRAHK